MPINFNASQHQWQVVEKFRDLNKARTPGRWNMDDMEFPEGDPDRKFIEFVTEHAEVLIAALREI